MGFEQTTFRSGVGRATRYTTGDLLDRSVSFEPKAFIDPETETEVKDIFGRPGARVGVGSARLRPLAVHGVWCPAAGLNLETGQLSRHYIAEVTLNHNQPTNQQYVHRE